MKINRRQLAKATLLGGTGLQLSAQAAVANISHGPFLGHIGSNEVWVWARNVRAGSFRIRYGTTADAMDQLSGSTTTNLDHDLSAWLQITGLKPGTDAVAPVVAWVIS